VLRTREHGDGKLGVRVIPLPRNGPSCPVFD
jgi:hypothetical protein